MWEVPEKLRGKVFENAQFLGWIVNRICIYNMRKNVPDSDGLVFHVNIKVL